MAATDQNYRSQYGLDIVFAVSSILMLLSIVWMLWDDFNREYKTEQRMFRDVEVAMAQREALSKLPDQDEFDEIALQVEKAREHRKANQAEINKLGEEAHGLLHHKEEADLELATLKADLDSKTSFYDIEVDHHGQDAPLAKTLKEDIDKLNRKIVGAKNEAEKSLQAVKDKVREKDNLEQPLNKAISNLKKLLDGFDRQVALSNTKKWGWGDIVRSLPVIDGFASPTKIDQITLHDLGIDYNFKYVTRFDRCITCHKGIARQTYTENNLRALLYEESPQTDERLKKAHQILERRKELLAGLDEGKSVLDSSQLKQLSYLSSSALTNARISEFSAHPRLDLFVGPNSKHPSEKFGCTACHSGQPSGTSFNFAAHSPNDSKTQGDWVQKHHWESQHMWDFPMLPKRFVESSCIKCHHEVTDLYSDGNKVEAPKVVKGYDLVREYGCYGCHEISGYGGGRRIGPDMRLEPNPPLDKLTVAERAKLFADPDNPPGNFPKVGPSLFRLSEKTNEDWAVKWIMAPREFRSDTKMPHYYGLSNNDVEALKGTGQESFPATEVHGIAHVLFNSSRQYLDIVDDAHKTDLIKKNEELVKDLQARLQRKETLSSEEVNKLQAELRRAQYLLSVQNHPRRLDLAAKLPEGEAKKGRDLFTKKGCLSCHSHSSTDEPDDNWPAAPSDAEFAPNLIQLKDKLIGADGNKTKATVWLVNWLKNPTIHSPRTKMPITHLNDQEAADIAAWLLSQSVPTDKDGKSPEDLRGSKWASTDLPKPKLSDLEALSQVYLVRMLSESEMKDFFEPPTKEGKLKLPLPRINDLGADEQELARLLVEAKDEQRRMNSMLQYVGKKAIGRLGCYGCHDIPGFDSSKPIGTPLNDWGRKDPTRLAFEDIVNYVNKHYDEKRIVDSRLDEDGFPRSVAKGPLYERFFYDALVHKTREGYLNQKILDPRSFDYGRIRAWDDRSRMPQFGFARINKKPMEDETAFNQRKLWGEAMLKPLDPGAKPRPTESAAEFLARKDLVEAEDREAVMNFVLGLVADPIPLQYLNRPGPDRLAEVKGRQIVDKFNCGGCHVLRPGEFQFKITKDYNPSSSTPSLEALAEMHAKFIKAEVYKDDQFFAEHRAWNQPLQTGNAAVARGVRPLLTAANKKPRINLMLTDSLRLAVGENGERKLVEFRASDPIALNPGDMIWPPPEVFNSTEDFKAWEKKFGTQGGAFAALLSSYLKDEHPEKGKYVEPGPFVPPLLIGQGERTQPDWLFQFLLDPQKVRELPVLRMPKFNMSAEEARTLVDYFAAIEKRTNPHSSLVHPFPKVPQRSDLTSDYWKNQTAAFIERLKEIDNAKKSGGYQDEVRAFSGSWERMIKDWKTDAQTAADRKKSSDAELEKLQKELADAKGEAEKAQLKKKVEAADLEVAFWRTEKDRLDNLAKTTPQVLEEQWRQTEAYALAGYRLLVNQCNKCHGVGNLQAQQEEGRGPSLNLSAERLRPEWSFRWIANPQRFIPYVSAMPQYFKNSEKDAKGNDLPLVPWLPGHHPEQIGAARDAIMNLQRISELPLTRYWMQGGGK